MPTPHELTDPAPVPAPEPPPPNVPVALAQDAAAAQPPSPSSPPPEPSVRQRESVVYQPTRLLPASKVVFELVLAEFQSVSAINDVSQSFSAQLFLRFRIAGGANIPAFAADLNESATEDYLFPKDGSPPAPPLMWYMNQLDIVNSSVADWQRLDQKVFPSNRGDGSDIFCQVRFAGTFHERLELHHFPFDEQLLQILIVFNCRREGVVPVEVSASGVEATVVNQGFRLHDLWYLVRPINAMSAPGKAGDGELNVREYTYGLPPRSFPGLLLSGTVQRRPTYYLVNIALPMGSFVLLSFLQFTLPASENAHNRLAITLTLVLTAAAFKQSVSSMLPSISYLTLLDQYVMFSWAIIVLATFEGGLVSLIGDPVVASWTDRVSFGVLFCMWLLAQARFLGVGLASWGSCSSLFRSAAVPSAEVGYSRLSV